MRLTVATWNINSIRLREMLIARLLKETSPDIICLQETKALVEQIPRNVFNELGYRHLVARGEKGYNGVAILSRFEIEDAGAINFCEKGDARHVAARLSNGLVVHNLYVPSGGDEPNPTINPKFDHKLKFVDEIKEYFSKPADRSLIVGDLNIAPMENDVWSHRQLLNVVSHTPIEVDAFEEARAAGNWIDAPRRFTPADEKLYSWWSYRSRDWRKSNRGRRLDHIWASPDLDGALISSKILAETRDWEKTSDHVPVFSTFDL